MVALGRIRAALVAAVIILCGGTAHAQGGTNDNPSFLAFGGTDLWRDGMFLYGGVLWSPVAGLDSDGLTLKILLGGGGYSYFSNGLHQNVNGTMEAASALPGWRFSRDGVIVNLYAGPIVQDYRLTPYDPGSRLRGFYVGGQVASDVWYEPTPATMAALNGSLASIGAAGSARAAFGWKLFDTFFAGPETQGIWCTDYQQVRFGAHVTALRIQALEWTAGSGWAMDSDRRRGPYLRFGVSARY